MTLAEILGTVISVVFVISGVWLIMDAIASAQKRAEREARRDKVDDIKKKRSPFPLKTDDDFYVGTFTFLLGFSPKDYRPEIHDKIIREKALTLTESRKQVLDQMLFILFGKHLNDVMTEGNIPVSTEDCKRS